MPDLIPTHLKYTKEHEWALAEGDIVTIGISYHAQNQLGDVVYLELPNVGQNVIKDKVFGTVESVKAVSDLFSPVTGQIVESNQALLDQPEIINQDPYQKAWMIKVRITDHNQLSHLMDSESYSVYLKEHTK